MYIYIYIKDTNEGYFWQKCHRCVQDFINCESFLRQRDQLSIPTLFLFLFYEYKYLIVIKHLLCIKMLGPVVRKVDLAIN